MLELYVYLTNLRDTTLERSQQTLGRFGEDRGSVTLETVAIALGLFLLASLVVAGIGVAVNSRLAQIR